jgi:hypothetical protein
MHGVTVYTNYDFIEDEPLAPEELAESESVGQMTMAALLEALEAQNSLI